MYYQPMMELQYQRIDGITGIYYNTPYVIQACITTHTMELQACITTNRWNYSITQLLELQASITTHHMEYRHLLLNKQWNYSHVLPTNDGITVSTH